jgi:hypothetical protein
MIDDLARSIMSPAVSPRLNERYFNLSIPCDRRAARLNGRTALEIFEAQFQFLFNKRDKFQASTSSRLILEIV